MWLKAELHTHCNLDPIDRGICAHSAEALIVEARRLCYDVLSITCHNRDIWNRDLDTFAKREGIILIPGMEVTTEEGKHVLVYNFRTGADELNSFDKISARKRADTLVIAPHPFFPGRTSLGELLERHIGIVDAIEYCGFFSRLFDFNPRAILMAHRLGKPMVAGGDVHHLWQLGKTYTWIYAEPSVRSIVAAVKDGMVEIQTEALSNLEIARWWITLMVRKRSGCYAAL